MPHHPLRPHRRRRTATTLLAGLVTVGVVAGSGQSLIDAGRGRSGHTADDTDVSPRSTAFRGDRSPP